MCLNIKHTLKPFYSTTHTKFIHHGKHAYTLNEHILFAGEQIALNVDGCEAHNAGDKSRSKIKNGQLDQSLNDSNLNFPDGRMDRQVLTSTRAIRDTSRYAIGVLDKNELHITPLEGVLSLRPSMEYLDQSDKTAKGMIFRFLSSNHIGGLMCITNIIFIFSITVYYFA